ncbi:MAG: HDOD domain-containing protein [Gammaproteobacteria bacterium]|nr:HDOD domain-containing protein [Gammaproteobacteria bacterium]
MAIASSIPDIETLQSFTPFRVLSDGQLKQLSEVVEIEQAPAGRMLIKRGSRDNYELFLVEGRLRLRSEDGRINDVKSGDSLASVPIAKDLPRHCDVISVTPVRFLRITNSMLQDITSNTASDQQSREHEGESDGLSRMRLKLKEQIADQFRSDLEKDRIKLPSLPEVAIRIGEALKDDVSDAEVIAEIVQVDPTITAKLIKAANSAMYGRCSPVETCASAVVRLGTGITHKLVLSFAMRELFQSSSVLLQGQMRDLWTHSTHVAAISFVLAKHDPRFNPEQAMLAGLLHDIGVVAVLQYLDRISEVELDPDILDAVVDSLRAQTSSAILRKWGFPIEFSVTASECEDWMRDKEPFPDYCDLVLAAHLHSFSGTKKAETLPTLDQVPAYTHLGLGELTSTYGLKIVDEAEDLLDHAQSLLNI